MRCPHLVFLLALLPTLATAQPAQPAEPAPDPPPEAPPGPFGLTGTLEARFEALTNNALATEDRRQVTDLRIADALFTWTASSGVFTPLKAAGGATIGGWFGGECTVAYTPPLGQERAAFERGTGKRELAETPCTELYFVTDDPAVLAVFEGGEPAQEGPSPGPMTAEVRKRNATPKTKDQVHADFALRALRRALGDVEGSGPGHYLELSVATADYGRPVLSPKAQPLNRFDYLRDPHGRSAVHEAVLTAGGHTGPREDAYSVSFTSHPEEGPPETSYRLPNLDLVKADLDIHIDVEKGESFATMDTTAELTLTTRHVPVTAVSLQLVRDRSFKKLFGIEGRLGFEVSAVTDFKGRPLEYLHQGGSLLVRLRSPLPPGQGEILHVTYAGNAMPRIGEDSFGLLVNYAWWPQGPRHDRFQWATSLCFPKAFRVAGTGTTVKVWDEGEDRCERWEEPVPVGLAAINMGRWVTAEIEGPRGIPIRAFFLEEDAAQMEGALQQTKRALEFYEGIFTPYPYGEMDIAQGRENMGFWQAPAGLLELSKTRGAVKATAKKILRSDFFPEASTATLSHEIGHQWWGHVVGWKSYRDQWISESFAEYSSFLYMNQFYGEESYLGRLEYWELGARKSDRFGPAVLGSRLGRGYTNQVYARGPYLLHMLRREVGDKPFAAFLSTLAEAANNRNISTSEMEAVAQAVLGEGIQWFFDQWLHKTGLPDLEVAWRVEGKTVFLDLLQTQPEPPMRLVVPVELKGKGKKRAVHHIATNARSVSVELPLPGGGLKKVLIDPEREVLTGKKQVRQAEPQ